LNLKGTPVSKLRFILVIAITVMLLTSSVGVVGAHNSTPPDKGKKVSQEK